jgi:hypothetical protein
MRARLVAGALVAVVSLVASAPALAGGWAVTTLDTVPGNVKAGESHDIGFTIRQHGETPFNQAQPRIRANSGDTYLSFGARRDGNGHYVATVQFPHEGTWTWVVDQTPFATQPLGTLTVVSAAPPPPEPAPAPAASVSPSLEGGVLGYAAAAALAAGVLIWRRPMFARGAR